MSYFEKNKQFDPYRESSIFFILEVGRNTILTSCHKCYKISVLFLYYLGVANNLGKTVLSC